MRYAILLVLVACVVELDVAIDAAPPNTAWGMHLGGPYAGALENDVSCSMNGGWLEAEIEIDKNGNPWLPKRGGMPCELFDTEAQWLVHCRESITFAFGLKYFDDFTFKIRKEDPLGSFFWWVDGHGYFNCIHVFWITEVETWHQTSQSLQN